jgi:hypothetical protein
MEIFDQWAKNMEKMWSPWQDMMKQYQGPKSGFSENVNWDTWFAAMRSAYDINFTWLQTFMDQGEEMFFRMFKEAPFYSAGLEQQLRELWNTARKAQKSQSEIALEMFSKMESLLKEKEENR